MSEIDDSKMPLLDHLVELRNRLFYALIAYIAAFLLCYWQSKAIFQFLNQPLSDVFHGQTGRTRTLGAGLCPPV